ncbi:endothelial cell-specific chemotaxis regulator [Hemicordylus capensis]|uniref:endothelial cell-specific chemotaxis regulator n=1 Tax=Hemicordylus capensis TaxID=884348 RepID=UPI00230328D9|nr:endothelial cell-specific chemotaxis regulator [Hemicordylus capensis]
MKALQFLTFVWICDCVLLQGSEPSEKSILFSSPSASTGISVSMNSTIRPLNVNTDIFLSPSTPTEDKSQALTMAVFGVISFIVILVLVVIILVSVVSLRFKCRHCKDAEDKQKPQHPLVSYSCSDADASADKNIVTLVSMKNFNTNNSKGMMKTAVTHEEQ